MMLRKIIKIDEDKCTGCGLCASACHEGAIKMIGGKAKLTREDVNRAIKTHLARSNRMVLVVVAKDAAELKKQLASAEPATITYNSSKAQAILDEDEAVAKRSPGLKAENIKIVPVDKIFQ
jgi:ferredoxin